jgi:hypothetical protein
LGGGTSAHLLPERRELLTSLFGEKANDDALSTPRLWLTKGLPLPIDLGLAIAYANGTFGSSVYSQWTVFEGFRRPALAIRVAEGRLYGARGINLGSTTTEAILSYGVQKFLTAYANFGMARHRGHVSLANNSELGLLSTQGDEHTEVWQETVRRAGLQLGSPFFTLTAETTLYPDNIRDYAAKIAILL